MLKIEKIQNVYLNGKAATVFSVYELVGNTWIFDYATSVDGHWKKAKTVATKHLYAAENPFLITFFFKV